MATQKNTRLRLILNDKGLSDVQVAAATGLHRMRVHRLVSGKSKPRPEERALFSQLLDMQESELFETDYTHLTIEDAKVERLCDFLRSPDGKLFVFAVTRVLED